MQDAIVATEPLRKASIKVRMDKLGMLPQIAEALVAEYERMECPEVPEYISFRSVHALAEAEKTIDDKLQEAIKQYIQTGMRVPSKYEKALDPFRARTVELKKLQAQIEAIISAHRAEKAYDILREAGIPLPDREKAANLPAIITIEGASLLK